MYYSVAWVRTIGYVYLILHSKTFSHVPATENICVQTHILRTLVRVNKHLSASNCHHIPRKRFLITNSRCKWFRWIFIVLPVPVHSILFILLGCYMESGISTSIMSNFEKLLNFVHKRCQISENIKGCDRTDKQDKCIPSSKKTSFTTSVVQS